MSKIDEYDRRISILLKYIEENLSQDLSLNELSKVANFSPYHFQRIVKARLGESPYNYIQRLRKNKAAYMLKYCPTKTITQIAFECGYNSSSDFTRTFKSEYRVTPMTYRKNPKYVINKKLNHYHIPEKRPDLEKQVIRRCFRNETVACIQIKGLTDDFKNEKIDLAFTKLIQWGKVNGVINKNTRYYGMVLDNPEMVDMEECRYLACITTDKNPELEDSNIVYKTIMLSGDYICFCICRETPDFVKEFYDVCDYLYGRYLSDYSLFPDDRPFLERYYQEEGTIWLELCIPVKKQDL